MSTRARMTEGELRSRLEQLTAKYGEWTYDIPLSHGVWTRGNQGLAHTRLKRIVQIAQDLCAGPLRDARVLDLGCLEGQFSVEFALQGANVVGIDAREGHIRKAEFVKAALGLEQVQFVQADVRSVSLEKHGQFDVIVCSGLLYHLPLHDAISLVREMYRMATRLVIIDTRISLCPRETVVVDGRTYFGHTYAEHSPSDSMDQKVSHPLASWGNDASFWLSRPSLVNLLSHAGFSSVYECFIPFHVAVEPKDRRRLGRCTFVALKRQRIALTTSPAANDLSEEWSEGSLDYAPEAPEPCDERAAGWVRQIPARIRKLLLRST